MSNPPQPGTWQIFIELQTTTTEEAEFAAAKAVAAAREHSAPHTRVLSSLYYTKVQSRLWAEPVMTLGELELRRDAD